MPLQSKIVLFFIILLSLITFQWLFFITHEEKILKEEKISRGEVLTRTLAQLSVNPMINYQITRLEGLVDSIKSEEDVLSARIVTRQYLVLADTSRENEGWIFSGQLSDKPDLNFSGDTLVVREPILIMQKMYGMAEVVFSLETMNVKILHSRILFIVLLLIELMLSAAFAVFLEIQVIRPLGGVAAGVEQMPLDEFEKVFSIPLHSTVEIQKVGEALENMRGKLLENREELVSKAKFATMGKIAFNLAHEIRNPLEAISGSIEILGTDIEKGSGENDYVTIIKDEIRNLKEYLTEFLEFTRSQPRNREYTGVEDVLEDTLLLLSPLIKKSLITLRKEYDVSEAVCFIDVNQIKRVFLNVLINSIEALSPGGEIDIKTSFNPENEAISVFMRDNGTGIPEEVRGNIFEPYFTTKKNGSGIGLALSKKIIEQHGGTIEINSIFRKETEVIIQLPAVTKMELHA